MLRTVKPFLCGIAAATMVVLWSATVHADGGRRVALVIGNGAYQNAPTLPNPANDAKAVAEALRGLDFEVIEAENVDQPDMLTKLDEFSAKLDGADTGLFFFAGHGLQVAGENYLVPTDARLQREAQVRLQTIPLQTVLATMEATVATRLVILDACRDNPLAQQLRRSMSASRTTAVGQGLAEVRTPVGTLVAYATGPGEVASDGQSEHSPFTAALLDHIATPGLEVRLILSRVREEVQQKTNKQQLPWDSSSLLGEFYFQPAAPEPAIVVAAPSIPHTSREATTRSASGFDERQIELGFWESIRESGDSADFQAYLHSYPNGSFAALARNRLKNLGSEVVQRSGPDRKSTAAVSATMVPEPSKTSTEKSLEARSGASARANTSASASCYTRPGISCGAEQPSSNREAAATIQPILPSTEVAALPETPRIVTVRTPAEVEAGLGLSRDDWRALQRAITALGFDTRGADGRPGLVTRQALAGWQKTKQIQPSGYLSPAQRRLIISDSQSILDQTEKYHAVNGKEIDKTLESTSKTRQITIAVFNDTGSDIHNITITGSNNEGNVYGQATGTVGSYSNAWIDSQLPSTQCTYRIDYEMLDEQHTKAAVTRDLCNDRTQIFLRR